MKIDCVVDNVHINKKSLKIFLKIDEELVEKSLKYIPNFIDKPLVATLSIGSNELNVHCEMKDAKTLKEGMKVVLVVGEEQSSYILDHIYKFIRKSVIADIRIDEVEQAQRLKQISDEQRRKIYAIFEDMANYIQDTRDNVKADMKRRFIRTTQYNDFSLSDCSRELASDFIEFLVEMCFMLGVPLEEKPLKLVDDVDKYLIMCLEYGVCSICGQSGEVHHWDTVGMGRNRYKIDDSNHRKLSLCRIHHREAHVLGVKQFEQKYHVHGVIWNEEGDRVVNS